MSTSDDIGEDFDGRNALVAEYVLGLLSASEHARIGRLIEDNQGLRAERDFWVSRFAALNEEYEETPVPRHIYAAIEARAFGDVVRSRPVASFWENLMVWRGIAAGALAVAVARFSSLSTVGRLLTVTGPPPPATTSRKLNALRRSSRLRNRPAR